MVSLLSEFNFNVFLKGFKTGCAIFFNNSYFALTYSFIPNNKNIALIANILTHTASAALVNI